METTGDRRVLVKGSVQRDGAAPRSKWSEHKTPLLAAEDDEPDATGRLGLGDAPAAPADPEATRKVDEVEGAEKPKQSRLNTIASMVNTMMGTTIVSLPFGFSRSGIVLGICISATLCVISCFTALLLVRHGGNAEDFTAFIGKTLGRRWQLFSGLTSIGLILGAAMIYHILMQESIYGIVLSIVKAAGGSGSDWKRPIAAALVLAIFPVANLRDLSKLVKFNSIGTIFLWFTIIFISYHGFAALADHGITHFVGSLTSSTPDIENSVLSVVIGGRESFGPLGGMMMVSFFIHTVIQPILKNAPQDTKVVDTVYAYAIVFTLYTGVGILGYIGFASTPVATQPGEPELKGNFLEMFGDELSTGGEKYAFAARVSLLLQLLTVFPILLMIIRSQFFTLTTGESWPSTPKVLAFNVLLVGITYVVAALDINVANVIRFVGAIAGIVLIFILPVYIDVRACLEEGTLTPLRALVHTTVILVGTLFFIVQFIPSLA